MANTWIFQVNPAEIDLRNHLRQVALGLSEREGEWQVQRHARRMLAGDRLLWWQSGPGGGLLAVAELLSGGYRPPGDGDGPWHVGYRFEASLEPPLSRRELASDPALRELSLLRRPQGRSFAVTPAQARRLESLLAGRLRPLPELPAPGSLKLVTQRIRKQGMQLSDALIRRYHLALQTASLVILAGGSGLGKSWLTQAYAQALQAHYLLVPVAPNWLGPEDLLGYMHPLKAVFQPTQVTRFVQMAAENWQHATRQGIAPEPYHLVLDEINLARVEYYLAPLLSLLEVRRRGEPARLVLADGNPLLLPPNLSCIGTLNMDETTQPLSDRVCDRAQIIELELDMAWVQMRLGGQAWGEFLLSLWPELQSLAPFAYRSLDEIEAYVAQAEGLGMGWQAALDEQLVQKILPRLRQGHGANRERLQQLHDLLPEAFALSRAKLSRLLVALQDQGFASYL